MDGTNRKTFHALAAALGLGLVLLAGCARTGSIQGRVRLPGDSRPAAETVIMAWRETDAPAESPDKPERIRMILKGGRFLPRLMVVPPGTTLEFENRDHVYHDVFSVSPAARFDLPGQAPGQVRQAAVPREGVVHVYCTLHPKEAAWVVVAPDHRHAQPEANGTFAFDKLPQGTWLVRAFHPALGDVTKRVRVESKKTAVIRFGS